MLSRLFHSLILMVFLALPVLAHNIYATFTELVWNDADKSVELVVQVHAHELEARLSLDLGQRLTFLEDADYAALEAATGPWAQKLLLVAVDGNALPLTYLGMELKSDIVYLYLEADWPQAPKTLDVMNAMFLADLPGQINTVMGVVAGKREAGEITGDSGPVHLVF